MRHEQRKREVRTQPTGIFHRKDFKKKKQYWNPRWMVVVFRGMSYFRPNSVYLRPHSVILDVRDNGR